MSDARARTGRERFTPWVEGALAAALVLAVYALAGDALRASYHGYLHAAIGEAVLRDGLRPENPWHAGSALRYYTLYPALGVLVGRAGPGPLWGFALLNAAAALCFAPALDAIGRSLGLRFAARRAALVAAVLGFNGLGWIGALTVDAPRAPDGGVLPPVFATMPLCFAGEPFGWDARLQAFLPKFLNASSFALAVPFALWALAAAPHWSAEPRSAGRPFRCALAAAAALALNPLVGGAAGVLLALWILPEIARERRTAARWIGAGTLAVACALPFLLGAFAGAPDGASLLGEPNLGGRPWTNLVGPLVLLVPLAVLGLAALGKTARVRIAAAIAVCALALVALRLPHGNEYKFARLGALFWALAASAWLGAPRADGRSRTGRLVLAVVLVLACVQTTALVVRAYVAWGRASEPLPLATHGGRLVPASAAARERWPDAVARAEAAADDRAVLLAAPDDPAARAAEGVVQGDVLAPALSRALLVDRPQIHNDGLPDLASRLALTRALYEEDGADAVRSAALDSLRAILPERPLLVLARTADAGAERVLRGAGGEELAREGAAALWSLAPASGGGR